MKSIKSAKLGTFLDVSSFETPFSYCGRMSGTKVLLAINFAIVNPDIFSSLSPKTLKIS